MVGVFSPIVGLHGIPQAGNELIGRGGLGESVWWALGIGEEWHVPRLLRRTEPGHPFIFPTGVVPCPLHCIYFVVSLAII